MNKRPFLRPAELRPLKVWLKLPIRKTAPFLRLRATYLRTLTAYPRGTSKPSWMRCLALTELWLYCPVITTTMTKMLRCGSTLRILWHPTTTLCCWQIIVPTRLMLTARMWSSIPLCVLRYILRLVRITLAGLKKWLSTMTVLTILALLTVQLRAKPSITKASIFWWSVPS